MLHIRLVVLPTEPLVGLTVNPSGLLLEGSCHVRSPSKPLPDRLRPPKGAGHLVLPLALVDQIVAVAAQEVASRPVEDRHSPAAPRARTDEPGPLSAEVAGGPV